MPPARAASHRSTIAAVVAQAQRAGVGTTIRVSLGGKQGRPQGAPIEADAYVNCITDGRVVNRPGAMFERVCFDLGAYRLTHAGSCHAPCQRP